MDKQSAERLVESLSKQLEGSAAVAVILDESNSSEEEVVVGHTGADQDLEPIMKKVRKAMKDFKKSEAGQ